MSWKDHLPATKGDIRRLEQLMSTIAERIGALNADVDNLEAEDKAAFDRLTALIAAGQTLTPEQEAQFDALEKRLIDDANAAKGIGVTPTP